MTTLEKFQHLIYMCDVLNQDIDVLYADRITTKDVEKYMQRPLLAPSPIRKFLGHSFIPLNFVPKGVIGVFADNEYYEYEEIEKKYKLAQSPLGRALSGK